MVYSPYISHLICVSIYSFLLLIVLSFFVNVCPPLHFVLQIEPQKVIIFICYTHHSAYSYIIKSFPIPIGKGEFALFSTFSFL